MRAARKNADRAANAGDPDDLARALKQIDIYNEAINKLHSALGVAEAEEIHFTVTIERINSNLEILDATQVTDCLQQKMNALGAARSNAPQFPGVKIGANIQPEFNLSMAAQYNGNAAQNALDETMRNLVLPAPKPSNAQNPLQARLKTNQMGAGKWQLSQSARYARNSNQSNPAKPSIPAKQAPAGPAMQQIYNPAPTKAPAAPATPVAPQIAKPAPTPDSGKVEQKPTQGQRTHTINLGFAAPYAGPPAGGQ